MEDKSSKIGIIAVIFALIAISASGQITTSDFYLNLMNGSVTLLAGNNVTLSEDIINKTITISSSGGSGISGNSFDDIYVNSINTNTTDTIGINADHIIFSNQSYGIGTQLQSPDGDVAMGLIDDGTHSRITMTSQDATYESVVNYASDYFDASIWDNINGYGTEYTYYTDRLINAVWGLTNYTHTTQRDASFDIKFNGNERYNFTDSQLNMNGANITNNSQITALQAGKVNKTGGINDTITGKFYVNVSSPYSGGGLTLLEYGRTSSIVKYRATLNDANGAFNFRVNIKDDISQDVPGATGWSFAMQPANHRFGITNILPNTTSANNPFFIYTPNSTSYPVIGGVFVGDLATTQKTEYPLTVYNLSGTGNAYACVNSMGTLYRSATACV